eukprot:TRINITY_DN990_c0_g1_i3.p1 TRINITY_DN990_c0_g1~~TRINITY_DN990_c0_g1_i3.p1  ORF type:complete len:213 (+),score=50.77 TRINITY_DN990_c0_g1_i3:515-1153(+)
MEPKRGGENEYFRLWFTAVCLRCIIHAVGPIWVDGKHDEEKLLTDAVYNSLHLAHKKGLRSISMPAIGSGIFGFPKPLCAQVMIQTTLRFYQDNPKSKLGLVCFTNFDKLTVGIFQEAFERLMGPIPDELKEPFVPAKKEDNAVATDQPKDKKHKKDKKVSQRKSVATAEEHIELEPQEDQPRINSGQQKDGKKKKKNTKKKIEKQQEDEEQ